MRLFSLKLANILPFSQEKVLEMYNMLLEISSELDSIKIMLAKSRILLLFPDLAPQDEPCFQTKNCPIGSCRPSQDTPPNW